MNMNMNDFSSLTFGSSGLGSGPPTLKRKRLDVGESMVAPSKIEDLRVAPGKALRLDCDFITVSVGPEGPDGSRQSFKVHENAICDRSEFFRNSMKPEWASMRPDPRIIELPEDDPEAFSLYRTWLYSGKLAILPDDSQNPADPESVPEAFQTLAYAYVLGERLMDTPFKNAIADVYVLYARGNPPARRYYPSHEEIRVLYDGTHEGSAIRQLLVDIWFCRGKLEWLERDKNLPSEFLVGVLMEVYKNRGGNESLSRPWKNQHEQYHDK